MFTTIPNVRVYLAVGVTDMRKAIDGLSLIVSDILELDPFSHHLFVFCNRNRDKLKILQCADNGFWLYYRRLERGKFHWPGSQSSLESIELSARQLQWLLEGLHYEQAQAHQPVKLQIAG